MTIPFKSLGPDAKYPGATSVTWMAGFEWAAPGDIVELRWGIAGTGYDRGRASIGTIAALEINASVGPNGRYKRCQMTFWHDWYERTVSTVIHDESLMLVPDVRQMPFTHTFDLRTDDTGESAWQLVIMGHDCRAHGTRACESQWLPKAEKYLVDHPELKAASGE